MKTTQPIRDLDDIKKCLTYLRGTDETGRNALLFLFGINTALRIQDILDLRVRHIFTQHKADYRFREYIAITEGKTSKPKNLKPSNQLKAAIKDYVTKNQLSKDDFLFYSVSTTSQKGKRPIDRVEAWRILSRTGQAVGIPNLAPHSLRKTFGYHYYQATRDIVMLMRLFNHSSQQVTIRYIGLEQEHADRAYEEMSNIYNLD